MKLTKLLFIAPMLLFLAGCNNNDGLIGPQGPPGPEGPQGPVGPSGTAEYMFEYVDINFTPENDYAVTLEIPLDFEVYNEDKALVYMLWYVTPDDVDVWRLLPQTIFLDNGMFQYNYEFNMFKVFLFMDATFPLANLQEGDLLNQVVRVVIIPAEFWQSGRVDVTNYHEVAEMMGIPDTKPDTRNFIGRD